jgi:hypothetical protein
MASYTRIGPSVITYPDPYSTIYQRFRGIFFKVQNRTDGTQGRYGDYDGVYGIPKEKGMVYVTSVVGRGRGDTGFVQLSIIQFCGSGSALLEILDSDPY